MLEPAECHGCAVLRIRLPGSPPPVNGAQSSDDRAPAWSNLRTAFQLPDPAILFSRAPAVEAASATPQAPRMRAPMRLCRKRFDDAGEPSAEQLEVSHPGTTSAVHGTAALPRWEGSKAETGGFLRGGRPSEVRSRAPVAEACKAERVMSLPGALLAEALLQVSVGTRAQWQAQPLHSTGDVWHCPSPALDSNGDPHVVSADKLC